MSSGNHKTWLWWSSGKDSAWALHTLRQRGASEVCALVTTVTSTFGRVSMHAVPTELLRAQARAVGVPLRVVEIPHGCDDAGYRDAATAMVRQAAAEGVGRMAFGDLYLTDVREHRLRLLAGTGIRPEFPLWGEDTALLSRAMVRAGLVAHVTCVDPARLPEEYGGRPYDATFLDDLPGSVDPCGENGEFHTFVSDGPMFSGPVQVQVGQSVKREGFVFADLRRPARGASSGTSPRET